MANNRILTLNIGAGQLALAEFAVASGQAPELQNYAFAPFTGDLMSADSLALALETTLRKLISQTGFRSKRVMVALSGQMVFPRFVKIMAESPEKLGQQIQFEAEQNVPFPINEVVWTYELIGAPELGEQQTVIVAAKKEIVSAVTQALLKVGLEPEVIGVAPMAIYNAVRYNYPEQEGCMLVVDIGARSTNLIFVEQDRVFCRTIPVAGQTISQEIAKAFGVSVEEAEACKLEQGFVAQGGAYAAEDPNLDRMSKVVRNVMTRLHAEISRSINFYRSQQGGSAPTSVLLTGGSSKLPYMQEFFTEKLQVSVELLDPFKAVPAAASLDRARLGDDVFELVGPVGLSLQASMTCPIEINLVSEELRARKVLKKKIPFFAIIVAGVFLTMLSWIFFAMRLTGIYEDQISMLDGQLDNYHGAKAQYDKQDKACKEQTATGDAYKTLLASRSEWTTLVRALNTALFNGTRGAWIRKLTKTPDGTVKFDAVVWQDAAEKIVGSSGKTIAESIRDNLTKTNGLFSDQANDVKIDVEKKDSDEPGCTTFSISAKLKSAAAEPETNKSTRRRKN